MQKNILCLMLTLITQQGFALTIKDSPIQQVTLYPNGAWIERDISVQAGMKSVELTGLTANFNMDSLQIQSKGIDVTAVTSRDSAIDKPAGQESRQLQQQIKIIEQQLSELNAKIQAAELQNRFLVNLSTGNPTSIRQQAYDAYLSISQNNAQKLILEQQSKELKQDLAQIGDNQFNQRTLFLSMNAAQSGIIHLRYQIPYATWRPSYKAELNSQTGQLKLTRMAEISQKTGEDWNNILLTLSTNVPKTQIESIQPNPWWVNYYEEPKITAYPAPAPMAMMAKSARADEVMLASSPEADSAFPQFAPVEQSYQTEFNAASRTSIPSSQQKISLPLDQQQYQADIATWVIPQQREVAYLIAQLPRLTGDYPQGTMKLYRDEDYIGERIWQNNHDEFTLFNFGEDQKVKVKVDQTPIQYDKTGALSKQNIAKQHKHYQVTNLHKQSVNMVLFESIPQSQNSALKIIQQFNQQPNQTTWQNQQGIYSWQQQLMPQSSFNLDLDYQLRYPNNGYISGF